MNMNDSMASAELLEQAESKPSGQEDEEEHSAGTDSIGHDNDNDDDDGNDDDINNSTNNDCADKEDNGPNEDNADWVQFYGSRRDVLTYINPTFPVEAINGYMRAMYRDFVAQFGSGPSNYYDTSNNPAYKYFNIRWGLDTRVSALLRLDLLAEAIKSRGEHLSGLPLNVNGDHVLDAEPRLEWQDIQKLARFWVCCPKATELSISEGTRSFEHAKYFFQEAVAAGNQCRFSRLTVSCGKMETWSGSFVVFLQSSSSLKELRLKLASDTDRAGIRALFLLGLARNTSLELLHLQASEDWVTEPLQTMLMLRRQIQGCHLPSLIYESAGISICRLTPQMALMLMHGVCLGSVGSLQLQGMRMNQSSVIQLIETLKGSAAHPYFALKNLCMQGLSVSSAEDRGHALCDAISCLLNGVPGLEDVSIIRCRHFPFAYCGGPSVLRKVHFTDLPCMFQISTIDFARFLEQLPSSSIRTLQLGLDNELIACIQQDPRSLSRLEEFAVDCDYDDDPFCFVLFKIFASSMHLMKISRTSTFAILEDRRDLSNQNEFNQLCRRNRGIQAFQSSFVNETGLECAKDISRHSLWQAALAVLYRMELEISTILNRKNYRSVLPPNVDIPVSNVAGSAIYSFLQLHASNLDTATHVNDASEKRHRPSTPPNRIIAN